MPSRGPMGNHCHKWPRSTCCLAISVKPRCARGPSDLQNVNMRLFHPIKFMLATPAADLADIARTMPEEFSSRTSSTAFGRRPIQKTDAWQSTRAPWTRSRIVSPSLFCRLKDLASDAVLDGEIVPAKGDRILPFSELQKRLGRKTIGADLVARSAGHPGRLRSLVRRWAGLNRLSRWPSAANSWSR